MPAGTHPEGGAGRGPSRPERRREKRRQVKEWMHPLEAAYRTRRPRALDDDAERRVVADIDVEHHSTVPNSRLVEAIEMVRRARLVEAFSQRLDHKVGRKRKATLLAFFVVMQVVGNRRHHWPNVIEYVRTFNSLTDEQLRMVGMDSWEREGSYERFDELYVKWADAVREGFAAVVDGRPEWICEQWVVDRVVDASIDDDTVLSRTWAVDGTGIRSWGRTVTKVEAVPDDENLDEMPDDVRPDATTTYRAKVRGHTPKGRVLYTKDWEATGGYRSGNGWYSGGPYVGWETFAFTQVRDMKRNGTVGDAVAAVVRRVVVAPAGTHRNLAIVDHLVRWREHDGLDFRDLVLDRGHTYLKPYSLHWPMAKLGVRIHMDLHPNQRGIANHDLARFGLVRIDGEYFDRWMPKRLWDLEPHHRDDTPEERERKLKLYEERQMYRWEPHGPVDADGYQRLVSPWALGKLWSHHEAFRGLAHRRRHRRAEQVFPDAAATPPPSTVTVNPKDGYLRQPYPYGTRKWLASYGRRALVEGTFAGTKDTFTHMGQRGWVRTLGRVKLALATAFAVAGYNRQVQRQFYAARRKAARQALLAAGRRSRRRRFTVEQIVADENRRREETRRRWQGLSGGPPGSDPPEGGAVP